jgi:hypothetical protein
MQRSSKTKITRRLGEGAVGSTIKEFGQSTCAKDLAFLFAISRPKSEEVPLLKPAKLQ